MSSSAQHGKAGMPERAKWLVGVFVLIGLLFIAISLAIKETEGSHYWKGLLRELGTVVLAVFVISWLYEISIAERYLSQFSERLRGMMESGESNMAACSQLGILRIFPRRDRFQDTFPITTLAAQLSAGDVMRVVARSVFYLMGNDYAIEAIMAALKRGARLDLCVSDPSGTPPAVWRLTDTEPGDLPSAMGVFERKIVPWLRESKPEGSLEIRTHPHLLFDSYMSIDSKELSYGVWDLSFGRDVTAKRIVLLDPRKSLGLDLRRRYDRLWSGAKKVFEFSSGTVVLDDRESAKLLHTT